MPRSTRADLAKHSGKDDAWMTINGKVYDVSKYLEDHPAGKMPPTQPNTRTICSRLEPTTQAAPTHPGAQLEYLGSLP